MSKSVWKIVFFILLSVATFVFSHSLTSYGKSATGHWPKCSTCAYALTDNVNSHSYGSVYRSNDVHHWQICTVCGYSKNNKTTHVFDIDLAHGVKTCTVCGHEISIANEYDVEIPEELS